MDGEWKGKLVDCHDDFERILVTGDTEDHGRAYPVPG